jgi:hypothetical protein
MTTPLILMQTPECSFISILCTLWWLMWCIFRFLLRMVCQLSTDIVNFFCDYIYLLIIVQASWTSITLSSLCGAVHYTGLLLAICNILKPVMPLRHLGLKDHLFPICHLKYVILPHNLQHLMVAHFSRQTISLLWKLPNPPSLITNITEQFRELCVCV